jgi:hypothetical protein
VHSTTKVVLHPAASKLEGMIHGLLHLCEATTWSTGGDSNGFLLTCYPERYTSQQHCCGCHTTCWFRDRFDEHRELRNDSCLTSTWRCVCEWYCSPDITSLIFLPVGSLTISGVRWPAQKHCCTPNYIHVTCATITSMTLWLGAPAYGAIFTCANNMTGSSLNTYSSKCTKLYSIRYVWFCGLATSCHNWPCCNAVSVP